MLTVVPPACGRCEGWSRTLGGDGLAQAARAHVGPVLLDEGEGGVPRTLTEGDLPAVGLLGERGPKRVLALVVHQYEERSVLVIKRIRHVANSGIRVV